MSAATQTGGAAAARAANAAIKVLLIAPSLDILGGQAVQAQRLLAQLRQDPGLAMSFLAISPRLKGILEPLNEARFVRTALRFLCYLPAVCARVPRHDIIHVFSASYWSYLLWSLPPMLVGRLFGKKVILNYRSGEAEDHLSNWRTAIPTIRLAHKIVSPSSYLVDVFARFQLAVQPILNILDMRPFRYRERRPLRPVFFTHRILEPLYNVGCVLRAFQIVQRRYREASLTVGNDGICRPELEALARRLELRNVRFVGRIPHGKMPDAYDDADIYIMSPDLDCMPGTVLECFASGLPVVSTNAGGIPYIVRDEETGLLVNCGDHEALARQAIRLLEDEDLVARLSRQARQECRKYDGELVRQAWAALYRDLMRPSRRAV